MKTTLHLLSALVAAAFLLLPAPAAAQNLASRVGSTCRDVDHLTLLPGPGLLTPGHGISIPFAGEAATALPAVATTRPPAYRFLAAPLRGTPVLSAFNLTPPSSSGIPAMSFAPPAPAAVPVGGTADPTAPAARTLRFEERLNPAPSALRIDARRPLKRN